MGKPKPIKITTGVRSDCDEYSEVSVIGYKSKKYRSYICFNVFRRGNVVHGGFIEDRDLRRLKVWVDDCLKKRKP